MDESRMLSNDAQRNFRPVPDRVEHRGEQVTILRYKAPAAVLVPAAWYESEQAAMSADGPRRPHEALNPC